MGLHNAVLIPARERAARCPLWELVLPSCAKLFVPVSPMGAGIQDNSQRTLLSGHAPMPTSLCCNLSLLCVHTLLLWCECHFSTDTDWLWQTTQPNQPNEPTTGLIPLISLKYLLFSPFFQAAIFMKTWKVCLACASLEYGVIPSISCLEFYWQCLAFFRAKEQNALKIREQWAVSWVFAEGLLCGTMCRWGCPLRPSLDSTIASPPPHPPAPTPPPAAQEANKTVTHWGARSLIFIST